MRMLLFEQFDMCFFIKILQVREANDIGELL
jgi:hypothetical protein